MKTSTVRRKTFSDGNSRPTEVFDGERFSENLQPTENFGKTNYAVRHKLTIDRKLSTTKLILAQIIYPSRNFFVSGGNLMTNK